MTSNSRIYCFVTATVLTSDCYDTRFVIRVMGEVLIECRDNLFLKSFLMDEWKVWDQNCFSCKDILRWINLLFFKLPIIWNQRHLFDVRKICESDHSHFEIMKKSFKENDSAFTFDILMKFWVSEGYLDLRVSLSQNKYIIKKRLRNDIWPRIILKSFTFISCRTSLSKLFFSAKMIILFWNH